MWDYVGLCGAVLIFRFPLGHVILIAFRRLSKHRADSLSSLSQRPPAIIMTMTISPTRDPTFLYN
jgi:hypothetical protein